MRKETWDAYVHNTKRETAGILMDGFEISGPDKRVYYANDVYTDKNGVDMLDLVLVTDLTVHSKMPINNIAEHFLSVPKGYNMPWGPKEPEKPHTLYEQSAQENNVSLCLFEEKQKTPGRIPSQCFFFVSKKPSRM